MVQVPLIVDVESGINDMLDRDGKRGPIQFHISNDYDKHPIDARSCRPPPSGSVPRSGSSATGRRGPPDGHAGRPQGLLPRPRPQRYVDQWDWERS